MLAGHINWHPNRRELRQFGSAGLAVAILLAFVLRGVHHLAWGSVVLITAAGLSVFLVSWFTPRIGRWVYLGLTLASMPIGWLVSTLVLTLVYLLVFTPVALVFRLRGRDVLHRRFDKTADSYWVKHECHENPDRYYHQF